MIRITESPFSRGSRSSSRSRPACTVTSSAVVGSSAISSFGRQARAIAIAIRCRMPPENWCGKACSAPSGSGMRTSSSSSTARRSAALRRALVQPHVLGQLLADREHRVQRGERVLEDHRELSPADVAQRARPQREQVAAVVASRRPTSPRRRAAAAGARAPRSSCRCRLAGDAEHLALLDRVVDVVDDRDGAAFVGRRTLRLLDLEQRGHSVSPPRDHDDCGSSASRSESPRKLNASTTVKIARPGERADPPVLEVLRPLGDAGAPLGRRRLRAEAEEREPGEQQHRVAEVERREHEHRPEHVRQDVADERLARRACRAVAPTARTPPGRPSARVRARRARTRAS